MLKLHNYNKLAIYSLTIASIAAVSQSAFAHTRLEIPTVLEGTSNPVTHASSGRVLNYLRIGHGCPPSNARNPTYGTSLVFPNAVSYTPVIGVDSGTGKLFSTKSARDFYSPLAGIAALRYTGGPWDSTNIKVDALGNKDGFWAGGKAYPQTYSTTIAVDFDVNPVTINPASCARSVTFELAIADICDSSLPNSATASDEQVLFWSPIPNFAGVPGAPFGAPTADPTHSVPGNVPNFVPAGPAYSKYDGYKDAAHTIAGDGWGSPATLTVQRVTALPAGCTGNGGLGDDVYVYPSAAQINDELPVWSGPKVGEGTLYWK